MRPLQQRIIRAWITPRLIRSHGDSNPGGLDAHSQALPPSQINKLINKFSQRLDQIDWTTYEPYLWENEKESYKRCVVLFRFVVQLNHMYTGPVQQKQVQIQIF